MSKKEDRFGQSATLSEEEVELLFNELAPKYRLLFAVCLYTSCRISEALKLERKSIYKDEIVFRAPNTKTKKTRTIPISSKLRSILDEVELPSTGHIFLNKQGKPLSRQSADLALRKACEVLGIQGVSTHSFRRTAITRMHKAGIPIKTIKSHSGHADSKTLMLYIDVDEKDRRDAIEVI